MNALVPVSPEPLLPADVTAASVGPTVPKPTLRTDRVLLVFAGASLFVHATIMLPYLLRDSDDAVQSPKEIPVEIVQLPPPPKPAPPMKKAEAKPPPPQPKPAPKPPIQKAAFKPPPKPAPTTEERLKQLIGPMPAIAMPGASDNGTDLVSYSQLVLSKVAKAKKEGRYKGVPGAASVSFHIGDTGEVEKVEIVRPSGDKSLDDEAIAMIKRGAPYPAPPADGRRDYTITLRFQPLI